MERYIKLSGKYPHFIYHDYEYKVANNKLEGRFTYLINNDQQESVFEFFTSFSISYEGKTIEIDSNLDALVFNLGLVEAISYWKLNCAPTLTVKCGYLNHHQIKWWKKLFKKGLSEFFYLNGINEWNEQNLNFEVADRQLSNPPTRIYQSDKVLVPIGGGKDSITSINILKGNKEVVPLVMNPIEASINFINFSGFEEYVHIARRLDPQIATLNSQGFLNGHIPFSAVLSFYTMISSRMFGIKDIALSNESSANEPTILGTDINHQYSKSLEYERDINHYSQMYLDKDINYFSLLRPLNEYQITKIFAQSDDKVLKIFRSCNRGSRQGIWCCKCPKCLFTYIMLHGHLPLETMLNIYGSDLLDDIELKGYFLSLTGQRTEKPFECVGTIEEVNAALAIIKAKRANHLPILFEFWEETLLQSKGDELLLNYDTNGLNPEYASILRKKITDVVTA